MAEKTVAELTTEANTNFADNSNAEITPMDSRDMYVNMIDSFAKFVTDSGGTVT